MGKIGQSLYLSFSLLNMNYAKTHGGMWKPYRVHEACGCSTHFHADFYNSPNTQFQLHHFALPSEPWAVREIEAM